MTSEFDVVIVGSGPAGLSAGARAAATGMTHVVLEAASHLLPTQCDDCHAFHQGHASAVKTGEATQ